MIGLHIVVELDDLYSSTRCGPHCKRIAVDSGGYANLARSSGGFIGCESPIPVAGWRRLTRSARPDLAGQVQALLGGELEVSMSLSTRSLPLTMRCVTDGFRVPLRN